MNELNIFTYSLKTDVFIYEELIFLSQKIKTINVFTSVNFETSDNVNLPKNIIIHNFTPQIKSNKKKYFLFIKALMYEFVHKKNNTKYLLKLRYYFAYFNNAFNKSLDLENYLLKNNISTSAVFYSYWFNDWAFLCCMLKSQKKIQKVISRIHGDDVYELQNPDPNFFFPFRNFQIHQLSKIIAISKNGMQHISQNYSSSKNKVVLSRLGTISYGQNPITNELSHFVLVSCSSFYKVKNVILITKILNLLKFPIKWVHIGNNGSDKDMVIEASKQLPPNITTEFKGQLTQQEVFNFYKTNTVNLFINTSISEGIPVSIMEAISFGIPVMAPNVGGINEIVNLKTGFLFEPKASIESLANTIQSIFNQTVLYNQTLIRSFWEENYNAKNNYNDFFKLIQQL